MIEGEHNPRSSEPVYLVAIPAYNEAPSVGSVVASVRSFLPLAHVIVIDDGSTDRTALAASGAGARVVQLPCNFGYGNAIRTAIRFAIYGSYDGLILVDGDGQHDASQLPELVATWESTGVDVLVGSRHASGQLSHAPFGRRVGMRAFSSLTYLLTGQRIYDTTSGLKILRRSVFEALLAGHFLDFHAEALVYVLRMGFSVGEAPVRVSERRHGTSMYSSFSHLHYPTKTLFFMLLGSLDAAVMRRVR